jgi:RimJ/RimL family protein N-acetyltransferase
MTETFETRRLKLRPLQLADARLFARLFGDDRDAVAMTTTLPNPCTEEEAHKWIERHSTGGNQGFAIHRLKDDLFVGAIRFDGTPDLVELGFGIGRPFWGRGYATEAVRGIVDYVWDLGIGSVEACTFKTNPASARILEKCGFQDMGRITRNYPQRGGQRAVHRYLLEMEEADIVAE